MMDLPKTESEVTSQTIHEQDDRIITYKQISKVTPRLMTEPGGLKMSKFVAIRPGKV